MLWFSSLTGRLLPRLCGAMMKNVVEAALLLLLVFTPHVKGTSYSPPGKPTLTSCRSPEKETFTCWWQPGSDGGLPTTYALYYHKENSDTVYECPNYHTAGENSCFFNKNDTSIWVNYNITVVATNAMGSTFSDPVDIDVVYIVQPNPPEKVSVTLMEDRGMPFLRVSWEPPRKADTRSGWITLIYEIRIKLDVKNEWEMHAAGQQKLFNIFGLRSGGTYHIQVRCKPDHGFWSEWSSTSYIRFPDYLHQEKSVWILITVFSACIFIILTWFLHFNSNSLKHCLLPPVPGPKIKGFDKQLLKNGKSEEVFSSLVVSDFPPTASSNYEDLLVEYLEVYVIEEQELMLEESKDLHDGCLKSESSASDSDSGRGSCDSHTLLMDKCGEAKEEGRQTDLGGGRTATETLGLRKDWEVVHEYAHVDMVSPKMSGGRVKTWPSVFSPLPQYSSSPLHQQSSLETAKHLCVSDSLFPPGSTPSTCLLQPGHGSKEETPNYWEFCLNTKQPDPLHSQSEDRGNSNISGVSHKPEPSGLQPPSILFGEEPALLQPAVSSRVPRGGEYSKVKRVDSDNMLVLQRKADVMEQEVDSCPCEGQETNEAVGSCHAASIATQKPTDCVQTATPVQDEKALCASGYIDTATMITLPMY